MTLRKRNALRKKTRINGYEAKNAQSRNRQINEKQTNMDRNVFKNEISLERDT